jgi:A/G-specific adenine glycosylase
MIADLLAWYDRARRTLPWRAASGSTADPYHVLVSELMLQQTTVQTVLARFEPFIARFPNLAALAAATEAEVLHAWQGLGYYRRARALHACAQAVVREHGGRLPADEAALLALPGIGSYTAKAIQAIAFGRPVVPVDGNVMRVLARLHRIETPLPAAARELQALAARLEPVPRPADFAQALMDLGAMVCRPRLPDCGTCPLAPACAAREAGVAAELPRKAARAVRPVRRGIAFLLTRSDGAVLFRKRPDSGLLGGLHELPSSSWQSGALDRRAALSAAPAEAVWQPVDGQVRHIFTHFILELELVRAALDARDGDPLEDQLWVRPEDFDRLALPTVILKLLRLAGLDPPRRPAAMPGVSGMVGGRGLVSTKKRMVVTD